MNTSFHFAAGAAFPTFGFWRKPRAAGAGLRMIPAAGRLHEIQKGAALVVEKPLGCEVLCLQGALWITHDGDPKDWTLSAGMEYTADRPTRMLVYALESARIRLS